MTGRAFEPELESPVARLSQKLLAPSKLLARQNGSSGSSAG
jgi:hypothetical protein